jgi:thiJ/pfpI family protein
MDMTLGFIADQYGVDTATAIANRCEYRWQGNPAQDEFAALYR